MKLSSESVGIGLLWNLTNAGERFGNWNHNLTLLRRPCIMKHSGSCVLQVEKATSIFGVIILLARKINVTYVT